MFIINKVVLIKYKIIFIQINYQLQKSANS